MTMAMKVTAVMTMAMMMMMDTKKAMRKMITKTTTTRVGRVLWKAGVEAVGCVA